MKEETRGGGKRYVHIGSELDGFVVRTEIFVKSLKQQTNVIERDKGNQNIYIDFVKMGGIQKKR